jgi:hypothetical protein
MINKEPIQYLLFVYGDFRNKDKVVELISLQLSAFTTMTSNIKFNYGDYGAIYNFESEHNFFNIRDHVHVILEKVSFQYFLIEKPKNMYAYMPPEMKINLFDLFSDNDNKEYNITEEEEESGYTNLTDMFYYNTNTTFSEEDMFKGVDKDQLFQNIMERLQYEDEDLPKPTVDDILDKIRDKGIESLTSYEKQLLEEYSKQ